MRSAPWLVAFVGLAALAGGMGIGSWWRPTPEPVWTGGARSPGQPTERIAAMPSLAPAVDRAAPGIVTVKCVLHDEVAAAAVAAGDAEPVGLAAGAQPSEATQAVSSGCGFVVHRDGLVVTSRHVVIGARSIAVTLPRHGPKAAVLAAEDAVTDLAVLRLQAPPPDLAALELGRSEDLRAGDWIIAVGNPMGFQQTVTAGVVSFVGRHLPHYELGVTNDFLQFSAAVNRGSSGGPVLDLEGRVVGVVTQAPDGAQGISFAIPSRTVKWVLDELERSPSGKIRRGYLGIQFASRSGTDGEGSLLPGAVVLHVAEGEPAHRAGLRRDDVVIALDGVPIGDAGQLHERITRSSPGTVVRMTLLRGGKVQEPVAVALGEVATPANEKP